MEVFPFPQFEASSSLAYAALYTNVTNSKSLRARIIDAASAPGDLGDKEREAVNFAFIDARLITSRLHLQTAIYHAILAQSQKSLRTRTVHSEILWALNPTHNINEAIRRYGVSETTTALFVVRIGGSDIQTSRLEESMSAVVSGTLVSFTELLKLTDWSAVKEYHKLTGGTVTQNHDVVDNIVISTVAMKAVAA